jgi:hypothetical protein
MKKVAVIGGKGNMGRRYALILEKYCDCEAVIFDIGVNNKIDDCDGYIIATPTAAHYAYILGLSEYKKPILCEKPIVKSKEQLQRILEIEDLDLSMINQYGFIPMRNYFSENTDTEYNYFKTGNDGLLWDCINIIGLSKSSYNIKNDSLIWHCKINGDYLHLYDMDKAYIDNIEGWVNGWRNKDYILEAHNKVWKAIDDEKNK